ncbi:MAG: GyrI-like domain-containing protein, partial [Oscillospiraceae bacterium]
GASRSAPQGILGLCAMNGPGSKFHYYIAAAVPSPAPEGFAEITVPATTYAVFECTGPLPGSIQTLTGRIYGEWLPSSGYTLASAPDIEVYSKGDTSAPGYKSEVWVPVIQK